jgi:hypothetical protein
MSIKQMLLPGADVLKEVVGFCALQYCATFSVLLPADRGARSRFANRYTARIACRSGRSVPPSERNATVREGSSDL